MHPQVVHQVGELLHFRQPFAIDLQRVQGKTDYFLI